MLIKLSNFLQLEVLVIFKEKCLAHSSTKVWDFIGEIEKTLLDEKLSIEQKSSYIINYIASDISLLNFLLDNILDYDEETSQALQYFMEEANEDNDREAIINKLIQQGVEAISTSQYENDENLFENIINDLVEANQDHLVKDNVIYFVEGDFVICYVSGKGFNFEFFGREYKNISELLNLELQPSIDKEYTDLLLASFTFEGDWLDDIHSVTEVHYNEYGEEHEHSNLYGELPTKIVYWENEGTFFESVFERLGYIVHSGYDLLNTVFYSGEYQEAEEELFNENYPFKESFDDYLNELQHYFNEIYLNYIQKCGSNYEIEKYDRIVDTINNTKRLTDDVTAAKENFITALTNFKNVMDIVGYKDTENISSKYFTFFDNLFQENFNTQRFIELLKSVDLSQNEDLTVWKDSYLTLE